MPVRPFRPGEPQGARGRVLELLRRSVMTVNEMAAELGVTHNAVRGHVASLVHAGFVREAGLRRSGTRPSMLYEIVPGTDAVFSQAYIPFVAQLLRVMGERMSKRQMDDLMRAVGSGLASQWQPLRGTLAQRVDAAVELLDELGARTHVEPSTGGFVIRGYGCLLAEAVHGRPEVCSAMESLLAELIQAPVTECCERDTERPRCCFRIAPRRAATRSRKA